MSADRQDNDTPAIIELVDSDIRCRAGDGTRLSAPGFATLVEDGIVTGEEARRRAWLQPQETFNQFWHQLNLAPLPAGHRHARHHADLAYAQLRHLHEAMGHPARLLFAVPGSFSRDQLAILLGLTEALPARTVGLVDAAVAAASALPNDGEWLHLDLQLHQAVITRLRTGDTVERREVDVLPELGLKTFLDSWAHQIADRFIREYRYDPLHSAAGEQQLQDRLPDWLAQLSQAAETTVELNTPRGDFRLNLQRRALLDKSEGRVGRLRNALAKHTGVVGIVASHRLGLLPGLADTLNADLLPADSAIEACRTALNQIHTGEQAVDFVTRLPRRTSAPDSAEGASKTSGPAAPSKGRPTHVLYGHRAYPLSPSLDIALADDRLKIGPTDHPDVTLKPTATGVAVTGHGQAPVSPEGRPLGTGDTLTVGNHRLTLIEVAQEP